MSKHAKRLMLAVTVLLFTGACLALAQAPAQNQSVWSNLKIYLHRSKGQPLRCGRWRPRRSVGLLRAAAASGGIWKTGDGGNRW